MKRILIATDGSAPAQEAIRFGVELAKHEGAGVLFVHVVPLYHLVPVDGFGLLGSQRYDPNALDEKVLADAMTVAEYEGVPAASDLLRGDPVDEIVAFAEATDADLIVLGSHGHGSFASVLLGSVSRGVLGRSKRPVLIVRAARVLEPAVS